MCWIWFNIYCLLFSMTVVDTDQFNASAIPTSLIHSHWSIIHSDLKLFIVPCIMFELISWIQIANLLGKIWTFWSVCKYFYSLPAWVHVVCVNLFHVSDIHVHVHRTVHINNILTMLYFTYKHTKCIGGLYIQC